MYTNTKNTLLAAPFFILLFAAVLTGCKKEGDKDNQPTEPAYHTDKTGIAHIKKISWGNAPGWPGANEYTYDSKGWLSTITEKDTSGNVTYSASYEYYDDFVVVKDNNDPDTILVNEQGYNAEYTFDGNGHILVEHSISFTWDNDNMLSKAIPVTPVMYYTYLNGSVNTIGDNNTGYFMQGLDSKNLVNTMQLGSTTTPYTYIYDSQTRVTSKTTTGAGSFTTYYEYY
jgi:hypothetical protein